MIRIITIEREFGSGGGVIAEKVATRLGWKLWDQLLTEEIARRMDCDCRAVEEHEERRDPAYYRLLKAFMRGSFEGSLNRSEEHTSELQSRLHLVCRLLLEKKKKKKKRTEQE